MCANRRGGRVRRKVRVRWQWADHAVGLGRGRGRMQPGLGRGRRRIRPPVGAAAGGGSACPFGKSRLRRAWSCPRTSVRARWVGENQAPHADAAEQGPARGCATVTPPPAAVRLDQGHAGAAKILDPSVGDDLMESWAVHVSTSVSMGGWRCACWLRDRRGHRAAASGFACMLWTGPVATYA